LERRERKKHTLLLLQAGLLSPNRKQTKKKREMVRPSLQSNGRRKKEYKRTSAESELEEEVVDSPKLANAASGKEEKREVDEAE
jgi:hypothetical protein